MGKYFMLNDLANKREYSRLSRNPKLSIATGIFTKENHIKCGQLDLFLIHYFSHSFVWASSRSLSSHTISNTFYLLHLKYFLKESMEHHILGTSERVLNLFKSKSIKCGQQSWVVTRITKLLPTKLRVQAYRDLLNYASS